MNCSSEHLTQHIYCLSAPPTHGSGYVSPSSSSPWRCCSWTRCEGCGWWRRSCHSSPPGLCPDPDLALNPLAGSGDLAPRQILPPLFREKIMISVPVINVFVPSPGCPCCSPGSVARAGWWQCRDSYPPPDWLTPRWSPSLSQCQSPPQRRCWQHSHTPGGWSRRAAELSALGCWG